MNFERDEIVNRVARRLPKKEYRQRMTVAEWKGYFEMVYNEALIIHGVVSSKSQIKKELTIKPKEKLEQLLDEVRPHCQYWDCRNDVPLEENHANEVALICIDKQLELLRYLGSFNIDDLYDNLVKQKNLLK